MTVPTQVAVLISGNGSNLQAIIDAVEEKRLSGVEIAVVVSDRATAFGLERARRHNIPSTYFPYPPRKSGEQAKRARDRELADLLQKHGATWVVLAGWLRLLSPAFLDRFPMRVINLHPALPGQFPGLAAIERAFAAFQAGEITETGVMVHLVPDEAVDAGPVIISQPVPIHYEDNLESLTERVHETEHCLIVEALARVIATAR